MDPTTTVREARDAYLAENGFSVDAYESPWTDASFLRIRFRVPNTRVHQRALRMHDLHHVVTGYGTDLAGEGEISAWELRRGLRGLDLYVASIVMLGAATGAIMHPLRIRRAWLAAGAGNGSLFAKDVRYDDLLAMTVGDLRRLLGVPAGGVATGERRLHDFAPSRIAQRARA